MMRPVPSVGQQPQRRSAAHEAANQVDVDDAAEVLLGLVLEHRGRDGAGVVDQDMQCAAAKFGGRRGGFVAAAESRTSRTNGRAVPPAAVIDSAVATAASLSMSVTSTAAPAAEKARPTASPTPLPAPVTSAERPSRRNTPRCCVISSSSAGPSTCSPR